MADRRNASVTLRGDNTDEDMRTPHLVNALVEVDAKVGDGSVQSCKASIWRGHHGI